MELNERISKRANALKWSLGLAGIVVIGLAAKLIIGGIIAAATIIGAGLAYTFVLPNLTNRLANWSLRDLKNQAEENPIETLEQGLFMREDELQIEKGNIEQSEAKLGLFKSEVNRTAKEYPDSPQLDEFRARIQGWEEDLDLRRADYLEASKAIGVYKRALDEARAMFNLAVKMNEVDASMGGRKKAMQEVLEKVAVNAIDEQVNLTFAKMKTRSLEAQARKASAKTQSSVLAVANDPSPTLPHRIGAGEKVLRGFTLIEFLIVAAILGILVSVGTANYHRQKDPAFKDCTTGYVDGIKVVRCPASPAMTCNQTGIKNNSSVCTGARQ